MMKAWLSIALTHRLVNRKVNPKKTLQQQATVNNLKEDSSSETLQHQCAQKTVVIVLACLAPARSARHARKIRNARTTAIKRRDVCPLRMQDLKVTNVAR